MEIAIKNVSRNKVTYKMKVSEYFCITDTIGSIEIWTIWDIPGECLKIHKEVKVIYT